MQGHVDSHVKADRLEEVGPVGASIIKLRKSADVLTEGYFIVGLFLRKADDDTALVPADIVLLLDVEE